MTKPSWLVFTLIEQQIDVVEQELASFAHRDGSRLVPGDNILRLRENPRIAEDTAADEYAADAGLHPFNDLLRLHTIAAA